jgi:hypothetical protein
MKTKLVSQPLVATAVLVLRVPGRPADGRSDREGHARFLTWLVNAVRIALNLSWWNSFDTRKKAPGSSFRVRRGNSLWGEIHRTRDVRWRRGPHSADSVRNDKVRVFQQAVKWCPPGLQDSHTNATARAPQDGGTKAPLQRRSRALPSRKSPKQRRWQRG